MKNLIILAALVSLAISSDPNIESLHKFETVPLYPKGPFVAAINSTLTPDNSRFMEDFEKNGRAEKISKELSYILEEQSKDSFYSKLMAEKYDQPTDNSEIERTQKVIRMAQTGKVRMFRALGESDHQNVQAKMM